MLQAKTENKPCENMFFLFLYSLFQRNIVSLHNPKRIDYAY